MEMFNNRGELNASSLKEAAELVAKFASAQQMGLPSNLAVNSTVDDARKERLIEAAINTQEGKLALAQAMANPKN